MLQMLGISEDDQEELDCCGQTPEEFLSDLFGATPCVDCGKGEDYHAVTLCDVSGRWLSFCEQHFRDI